MAERFCAICQEKEDINLLAPPWFKETCGHEFHTDCLMRWYRSNHTKCPLCNDRKRTFQSMNHDVDDYLMAAVQHPSLKRSPAVQAHVDRWQRLATTITALQDQLKTLRTDPVFLAHTALMATTETTLARTQVEQAALTRTVVHEHYPCPSVFVKEEHLPLITGYREELEGEASPSQGGVTNFLLELMQQATTTRRGAVHIMTATYPMLTTLEEENDDEVSS